MSAVGAVVPGATFAGGGPRGNGNGNGNGGGGGAFKIGGVNIGRMVLFAGLGAAAAAVIPPLAVLGGPIGGAVVGALISLVL